MLLFCESCRKVWTLSQPSSPKLNIPKPLLGAPFLRTRVGAERTTSETVTGHLSAGGTLPAMQHLAGAAGKAGAWAGGCRSAGRWGGRGGCYKYSSSRACLSASRSAWQDTLQNGMLCWNRTVARLWLCWPLPQPPGSHACGQSLGRGPRVKTSRWTPPPAPGCDQYPPVWASFLVLWSLLFIFWLCPVAWGNLCSPTGMEPVPPVLGVWSLNPCTTREVPF